MSISGSPPCFFLKNYSYIPANFKKILAAGKPIHLQATPVWEVASPRNDDISE